MDDTISGYGKGNRCIPTITEQSTDSCIMYLIDKVTANILKVGGRLKMEAFL